MSTRVPIRNGRYRVFEEKMVADVCSASMTRADGSKVAWHVLAEWSLAELAAAGLPCREFQEPEVSTGLENNKKRLAEVLELQAALDIERLGLEHSIAYENQIWMPDLAGLSDTEVTA